MAVLSLVLLAAGQPAQKINFTDLETECRYDRPEEASYTLRDRAISYEGQYHVNNPDSELDYSYSVSGDTVTLEVESSPSPYPSSYWNDCKGLVYYEAQAEKLDEGEYTLRIVHDGEEEKKDIIEVS